MRSPACCLAISTHAPARGATQINPLIIRTIVNFNPRSRKGSDSNLRAYGNSWLISTHAPARGATAKTYNAKSFLTIAQGTLHKTEQQMYRYKILSLKSALVFKKMLREYPHHSMSTLLSHINKSAVRPNLPPVSFLYALFDSYIVLPEHNI